MTPAAIMRLIQDGANKAEREVHRPRLIVGEACGRTWATDSHWMYPVEIVRPLLDSLGLDTSTAHYSAEGTTLEKIADRAPDLTSLIEDKATMTTLIPLTMDDVGPVFTVARDGKVCRILWAGPKGDARRVGVRAGYLDLADEAIETLNKRNGERWTFTRYEQAKPLAPVRIVATKTDIVSAASSDEVIGLVMPVRLG